MFLIAAYSLKHSRDLVRAITKKVKSSKSHVLPKNHAAVHKGEGLPSSPERTIALPALPRGLSFKW